MKDFNHFYDQNKIDAEALVFVDLDQTFIKTDVLWEALLVLMKQKPITLFLIPFWFLQGRLSFKKKVFSGIEEFQFNLPVNDDVLEVLSYLKGKGHKLIMVSASLNEIVSRVCERHPIFDEVYGSIDVNLKGKNKADLIVKKAADKEWFYFGDSTSDIEIWKHANWKVVISDSQSLIDKMQSQQSFILPRSKRGIGKLLKKQLRIHQWAKNALIFIPLMASHSFFDSKAWLSSIGTFFAFSFLASSIYVLNDMMDLSADRLHQVKKHRPLASGDLSILTGSSVAIALIVSAFVLAALLSPALLVILFCYMALNVFYSFGGKSLLILDVVLLASMYSMRILAGNAATDIPVSPWLLGFSTFFFLGLAFMKRTSELVMAPEALIHGRAYLKSDLPAVLCMGVASSLISMLVLVLYFDSEQVRVIYRNSLTLWIMLPLFLYWVCRTWILAFRGEVSSDPVLYVMKDKISWAILAAIGVIFFFAL
ncbi:UbiA family prenyltransferase [Bdellovibrio sp. HCB209]|uniref:UbiA family prenyltransferase n=1 Tax=Bdellovibrio sp. HCB209 TaxID=3394354 RepID=UPI0039B5FCC3